MPYHNLVTFYSLYGRFFLFISHIVLISYLMCLWHFFSLALWGHGSNFQSVMFKHMLPIRFMSTCEIALRWVPQNTFADKSTLVQVMAWCCQPTSHYLNQGCPRWGITRPQWVKYSLCHVCGCWCGSLFNCHMFCIFFIVYLYGHDLNISVMCSWS